MEMDAYHDPTRDMLEGVEGSVELPRDPGLPPRPGDELFMDPLARALDSVESKTEGMTVPPDPGPPGLPWPDQAVTEQPRMLPPSPGPPVPPSEPSPVAWTELRPPPAARPYFRRDGLSAADYRPHFSGAGIRNVGMEEPTRLCPQTGNQVHKYDDCWRCDQWADQGAGFSQCYHDWLEEHSCPSAAFGRNQRN